MHYLTQCIQNLNLKGVYYTPKKLILWKIKKK
jgi:hypothetical protein